MFCCHTSALNSVYGRDVATQRRLRTLQGGAMRLTANGLPPFDAATATYDIADPRNAELPGTFALHTLLLREHNRKATQLTAPFTDDKGTAHPSFLAYIQQACGCQPTDCTTVRTLHLATHAVRGSIPLKLCVIIYKRSSLLYPEVVTRAQAQLLV